MQDDNVRWQFGTGTQVVATAMSAKILCDFCSSPVPVCRFVVNDFKALETDEFVHSSRGDWAACEVCAGYVLAKDHQKLLEHSFEALLYMHPEIARLGTYASKEIKRRLKEIHRLFFKHMKSEEPQPI